MSNKGAAIRDPERIKAEIERLSQELARAEQEAESCRQAKIEESLLAIHESQAKIEEHRRILDQLGYKGALGLRKAKQSVETQQASTADLSPIVVIDC